MKVVCGLGNPGAGYESTRHNVAWWVLEHAQAAWSFPLFRRRGAARVSEGLLDDRAVCLVEPLTYVNRSGAALMPLIQEPDFDIARDLLLVVDDVALDVGRVRIRPEGSSGGHNGLKSVEASLRRRDYARLRIGVGAPPPGVDLAEWVLSPFPREEEAKIEELLPELTAAIRTWAVEGVAAAAQQYNR